MTQLSILPPTEGSYQNPITIHRIHSTLRVGGVPKYHTDRGFTHAGYHLKILPAEHRVSWTINWKWDSRLYGGAETKKILGEISNVLTLGGISHSLESQFILVDLQETPELSPLDRMFLWWFGREVEVEVPVGPSEDVWGNPKGEPITKTFRGILVGILQDYTGGKTLQLEQGGETHWITGLKGLKKPDIKIINDNRWKL